MFNDVTYKFEGTAEHSPVMYAHTFVDNIKKPMVKLVEIYQTLIIEMERNTTVPEDKKEIVLKKLREDLVIVKKNAKSMTTLERSFFFKFVIYNMYSTGNPDPYTNPKTGENPFLRKRSNESSLTKDVQLIEKTMNGSSFDVVIPSYRFLKDLFEVYWDEYPSLRKYHYVLGKLYNEYLVIRNEFKTLHKWYVRLQELGY